MRSTRPRALLTLSILTLALPGCTLFAPARPIVNATPSACSSLLPAEWKNGVPSADLDNGGSSVGDWIKFGDAQTGQLDKANERYVAGIGIVERCEERDRKAVEAATRKKGIF